MSTVVQLVPGAPPLVNGVGDFALTVARAMRAECAVESRFIVCNPEWRGPDLIDGFQLTGLPSRDTSALGNTLAGATNASRPPAILLHLSPYGFAGNGAPFWLLRALGEWKRLNPSSRLVIYFHELYATSAPWRRGFWLSPLQRLCARGFVRIADHTMTSMALYAGRIAKWKPDAIESPDVLPVVSNVGEPARPPSLGVRRPRLVLWGSAAAKRVAYTAHLGVIERAIGAAEIEEVVDIGGAYPGTPARICGASVSVRGVLAASEVSALLGESLLAVCCYSPGFLAKSTLFAAFCAHRIPAIILWGESAEGMKADGLQANQHYLRDLPPMIQDRGLVEKLDAIAGAAHGWYAQHSSRHHAIRCAEILARPGT